MRLIQQAEATTAQALLDQRRAGKQIFRVVTEQSILIVKKSAPQPKHTEKPKAVRRRTTVPSTHAVAVEPPPQKPVRRSVAEQKQKKSTVLKFAPERRRQLDQSSKLRKASELTTKVFSKPKPLLVSEASGGTIPTSKKISADGTSSLAEVVVTPGIEPEIYTDKTRLVPDQGENDGWIDDGLLPRGEVVDESEPTVAHVVVEKITQTIEPSPEVVEQTETLLAALPELVQGSLLEFVAENKEPGVVLATQELVVKIGVVAARLHELAMNDGLDGAEAEQIRKRLGEWYEELLTTLELEVDEAAVADFIALVCSETYSPAQKPETVPFDNSLRERKTEPPLRLSIIIGDMAGAAEKRLEELARDMGRQAMAV